MANKGMIENVCVREVNGRPSVVSKTTFYRLQEIPEITMDELKEFRQNANKPKVRLDDIPLK